MSGLESVEQVNPRYFKSQVSENLNKDVAGSIFVEVDDAISDFDSENIQSQDFLSKAHFYALASQAKEYYDNDNYDAAYEIYWQILQMNIYDEKVLFEANKNLGNIFLRDRDFDQAEEFFNKAQVLNPKSDALLVNFGVLEIQRHNFEAAKERFRAAIELNANNDSAWVGLALIHREFGDIDLAWGNLQRALDENKANQTAIAISIDWGIRDHRLDRAASYIRRYVSEVDDTIEMRMSLAKILFCSGNFVEAKSEAETVLQRNSKDTEAQKLVKIIEQEVLTRKSDDR